jgi:triosephosphate isomerase (TIM)
MTEPHVVLPEPRMGLRTPIFEIGLKGYLWGDAAVRLAEEADRASAECDVTIVFDPQTVDIPAVAAATEHLLVFAQHMDGVAPGRGQGATLPEALKAAGAHGTMLNHAERPMTLAGLDAAIHRAREVGLLTMVCTDSPEQAAAVARLGPDIVLSEPPALIGGDRSVGADMRAFVERTLELVSAVDPAIVVMSAAGIRTPADVARMVELGVGATGTTSGILRADDPPGQMWAMVRAMREAWDRVHEHDADAWAGPTGISDEVRG